MDAATKAIAYAARAAYAGALRVGASELEAFQIAYEIYALAHPKMPAHRLRQAVARLIVASSHERDETKTDQVKSSACWIGPWAAALLNVL